MRIIDKIWQKLFVKSLTKIEAINSLYITMHERPKKSTDVHTVSDRLKQMPSIGIVMQGPILEQDKFTLETIRIYKKHFPQARIILSTWVDQNAISIEELRAEGIEIVLLEKPAYAGTSNINYQIVSSRAGVLKAVELGCEYVMKTRTDQRMYAKNVGEYLLNLLRAFPMKVTCGQKQRIVACSLNTFKYRMYGISDMFFFGKSEDILQLWSCELDQRSKEQMAKLYGPPLSPREFAQMEVCEVYIIVQYLKKIGEKIHWTLEDSLRKYAEYFCIIDKESLDLYWPKYSNKEYRWLIYDKENIFEEVGFREWLILYMDVDNIIEFNEEITYRK